MIVPLAFIAFAWLAALTLCIDLARAAAVLPEQHLESPKSSPLDLARLTMTKTMSVGGEALEMPSQGAGRLSHSSGANIVTLDGPYLKCHTG